MTEPDRDEVGSLFAAARDHDVQARDELVRRLYPRVERLVHSRIRSLGGRDRRLAMSLFSTGDVTHEVFLGLLGSASPVAEQGEKAVIKYLATSVQNRLLDILRYQRAMRRDVDRRARTSEGGPEGVAGADRAPWRDLDAREKLDQYHDVLEEFPPKYKAVLRRRLEYGQSFAAIAEELELPTAGAARKMFHYVHAKLLTKLHARGMRADTTGADHV